ncbi:hypothetical protein TWF281_007381 [Arthrobotrys megalospora]
MTELKASTQTLDFDDEIALHLLVETAIFDSSGYELLNHEELDHLKQEQTILIGRIEALRRKLLLETKVRDAAQSLSRLRSPKQTESPLTSPVNAFGGSSNRISNGSMTQATAELSASIAKCHEIDIDIRKLEADLWVLERRLLCHTSRVLATTYHHVEKPRYHTASIIGPPSLSSSTPKKFVKYQATKSLEDFDARSLYRPANSPEESPVSHSEFITGGSAIYTTNLEAQTAAHPDGCVDGTIDLLSPSNSPPILQNRTLPSIEQKLTVLNDIVRAILAQTETLAPNQNRLVNHLISETNGDQGPASDSGISFSMLEQVATLERGLKQVQSVVSHQAAIKASPVIAELDAGDLLPVWDAILDFERKIREDEDRESNNDKSQHLESKLNGTPKDTQPDGSGPEKQGNGDRSARELTERVKSLTKISLHWAAEKRELQLQLLQKSRQNQLEIQKNEDAKTDHEQQIIGLTSSLSNTMNELSQISSKQDATTLQLKQEAAKLRGELDAKEQHHTHQIEDLQQMLNSQKLDFEARANDARVAAQERERILKEELQLSKEEVETKTRALEDSLAMAGNEDQKAKRLEERVGYLQTQLEKSQAAKLDDESQSLLDKQNLEYLTETLRAREARIEVLEQNVNEMVSSKSKVEAMYHDQSKRAEILDDKISDLQSQLRGKDAQATEQFSSIEKFKSRLVESQAAKKQLESNISTLQNEIQQLLQELATLADDLQATKTNSQRQIEEAKQEAAAKFKMDQGRSQPVMDANFVAELENLSKQNEELLKANLALQGKISESGVSQLKESAEELQALREKCGRLQGELNEILADYEVLVKASVDFEAEKSRLESRIDVLQDKTEVLERNLADERVRWLGNGHSAKSTANSLMAPLPAPGENMTISVLRAEFKKTMRDMRTEHSRALRGEQEARRRLENELRHVRRDQNNGVNSKLGQ